MPTDYDTPPSGCFLQSAILKQRNVNFCKACFQNLALSYSKI
ncbi:hypothetical protein GXM_05503 [Nostoc sphaeroides CCNUC1]|uniref:Uncharacterized protein n=1 Tax=Nostoc sphaeroides CCNUC1 TaxID=2653204 RepID=A0A5P8W679_9NOSO|nr:hypothetical protein GXM_05503 [Nostoc sphaeroides CCNUC1]